MSRTVAVCVPPLNYEATEGENVTISFKTAGLERADQVKITWTRGSQKKLIAQYCRCVHRGDCSVRETSGVLLRAEEGTVTLLRVSSNNSGLYEVIIIGKNVSRINASLVVNGEYVTTIYLFIYISIMRKKSRNDCVHKVI